MTESPNDICATCSHYRRRHVDGVCGQCADERLDAKVSHPFLLQPRPIR